MLATSRSWKRQGKILPWGLQRNIALLTPDLSLVLLSRLGALKGSLVLFPVRAHVVACQVPGGGRSRSNHTLVFLSLSYSLPPLSLKINKYRKKTNLIQGSFRF